MIHPTAGIDVHMGRYDMQCVDCHRTTSHQIAGRSMSVSVSNTQRTRCTDCHAEQPHGDDRLNTHTTAIACQTCHIPEMAVRAATKMSWDWSKAGEDRPEADPHEYLKIKGEFTYERNVTPEYYWYNGTAERYLKGDPVAANAVTKINHPRGDVSDPGEVQIDPAELLDLMHDRTVRLRIVDIRTEAAWNWFHLVDAEHLYHSDLRSWGSDLDYDEIVIVVDQDGQASPEAWRILQAREIRSSYLLDGGIDAWMERFGQGLQPASALGDRHPAALPDAHHGFDYIGRVQRLGKAPVLSGGCG